MIKECITPNDVVDLLNDALKIDQNAIQDLMFTSFPCNTALSNHPAIQVGLRDHEKGEVEGNYRIRVLGLLNGLFGTMSDGGGPLAMVVNKNKESGLVTDIVRFEIRSVPMLVKP